jgi:hypothetical protein
MADYTDLPTVQKYLQGQWGTDPNRDAAIGLMITRCSRMFDRETARPSNYWAPGTGITRRYSGNGTQTLEIDEFDLITGITMTSNQQMSDIITLAITPPASPTDPQWTNFVEIYPLNGPPFHELFLLRGWLPDAYHVGNVQVTGNIITPEEIIHAVTVWVVTSIQSIKTGWADIATRANGPGLFYSHGIPPETQMVIDYYTDANTGPKLALDDGKEPRVSKWLGWRT